MTVLIAGTSGFVGSNLSRWLSSKGMQLIALDVTKQVAGDFKERYTWEELDRIDFADFDAVVHLAGKAHDLMGTSQEEEYYEVNFGLTKLILDTLISNCKSAKIRSMPVFILMSSVKACADSFSGVMNEEVPAYPMTAYGKSKLMAEEYVRKNYAAGYILRSCMIHGPGNKGNFNLLFNFSRTGLPWPLGAFENARSFVSVENLCFVIEHIVSGHLSPGLYLVADDLPISTNRLLRLLWQAQEKRGVILRLPKGLVMALARIGDLIRLPLNSERLGKLTDSFVVSNRKIKTALEIDRFPIAAEDGLADTIRSLM